MKKKIRVGYFKSQITGVPRGALRLFIATISELNKSDEIELVCLGQKVSDDSDALGCIFEELTARVDNIEAIFDIAEQPTGGLKYKKIQFNYTEYLFGNRLFYYFGKRYNRLKRSLDRRLKKITKLGKISGSKKIDVQKNQTLNLANMFSADAKEYPHFSNKTITGKVVSLWEIDILLDLWWFHIPALSPLRGVYRPSSLKVVGWFLDAIPLRVHRYVGGQIDLQLFRALTQQHLESLDHIITLTSSSKDDLVRFFPHLRKSISVVPCGIYPTDFENRNKEVDLKLPIDSDDIPTISIIGAIEPSKNLLMMLKATYYASLSLDRIFQVLVIGNVDVAGIKRQMGVLERKFNSRVHVVFLDGVTNEERRQYILKSNLLFYCSLWEGFGIPPLEALALGKPVLLSDIAPLRETYNDIAVFADPYDVRNMADQLEYILSSEVLNSEDSRKQRIIFARKYLWTHSIRKLVEVLTH